MKRVSSNLNNKIKVVTILIATMVVSACGIEEVELKVGARIKPKVPIKQKCELIKIGMPTTEVRKIMENASTSKEYNQFNYGKFTFWNRPSIIKKDDLMPIMFPQEETCYVHFDKDQIVTQIENIFISTEQYQEKVDLVNSNMKNKNK